MKRLYIALLLIVCLLVVTSCKEETTFKLHIFSLNDFHGALYEDDDTAGISKIGNYIKKHQNKYPTIVVSAGDMFQGTAVSSMSRGQAVVDAMNIIGFDAMTLGNHEFDWGIEEVLKYQDGDVSNGEANFKFLAANIIDKRTNELASWAVPYEIVERENLKIGIIGVIGEDQTDDILASYVENYRFTNELEAINKYTKILRTIENCDIVIVSAHFNTEIINYSLSTATDEFKVDAIINGHTHQSYFGELSYGDGIAIPYVQSGSSGEFLGKIVLEINRETKQITAVSSTNINTKKECTSSLSKIDKALNNYNQYKKQSEEILAIAGETISRNEGANWAANALMRQMNVDFAAINFGGIRSDAFPIQKDSEVKYANIYRIMPFENSVVLVSLTGEEIFKIINSTELVFSSNFSGMKINGEFINEDKVYRIATIDYVFEKTNFPFKNGENIVRDGTLLREVLVEDVKNQVNQYGKFYASK